MSKDLLGGLGGLMKNFAAFMPQDDPNTKIFQAEANISDLEAREKDIYVQIAKKAYPTLAQLPEYNEFVENLSLIQKQLAAAQEELQKAREEKAAKEQKEQEDLLECTCSNCDTVNPEGVNFCQECGTKLGGIVNPRCSQCGKDYPAGTRFCGECGNPLS